MTKVDFYQVGGDTSAALELSCQLAAKAWQSGNDVLIFSPEQSTISELSERLWAHSATSFLPHRTTQEGPESIWLCADGALSGALSGTLSGTLSGNSSGTSSGTPPDTPSGTSPGNPSGTSSGTSSGTPSGYPCGNHHDLLINLAADTPDWFGRFDVLCELVYGDENLVASKRHRYKFYKDRGYPLNYHDMTSQF